MKAATRGDRVDNKSPRGGLRLARVGSLYPSREMNSTQARQRFRTSSAFFSQAERSRVSHCRMNLIVEGNRENRLAQAPGGGPVFHRAAPQPPSWS